MVVFDLRERIFEYVLKVFSFKLWFLILRFKS